MTTRRTVGGREARRRKEHALHSPSSTHGASPCTARAPYRSDRLVRTGSHAAPDAVERPRFGFSPVAGARLCNWKGPDENAKARRGEYAKRGNNGRKSCPSRPFPIDSASFPLSR